MDYRQAIYLLLTYYYTFYSILLLIIQLFNISLCQRIVYYGNIQSIAYFS